MGFFYNFLDIFSSNIENKNIKLRIIIYNQEVYLLNIKKIKKLNY